MMNWTQLLNSQRGRPISVSGDFRSEFERDYDRVVFSTPLRRLQDKTQVFPLEQHDAIRTRLTHTIEVSTVARSLTREVSQWLSQERELSKEQALHTEVIAATCGLVHDLGNPPFGHAGEVAIRDWFANILENDPKALGALGGKDAQLAQDFLNFDGNAQTIRLLCVLQVFWHRKGLNLTFGTLSAALKYVASSIELDKNMHEKEKLGYFASEKHVVREIQEKTGTGIHRNPLVYLVEAADDIVYLSVDLEDGIKKGVLTWEDLSQQLNSGDQFTGEVIGEVEKMTNGIKGGDEAYQETYGMAFRIAAIRRMVPAVVDAFKKEYGQIMAGTYSDELLKDSTASTFVTRCKAVTQSRVYSAPQVLRIEIMGRNVIHSLLTWLWEGVRNAPVNQGFFASSIYKLVSPNYRKIFEEVMASARDGEFPPEYLRLQLVADYVAGMTDTFACTVHRQLTNA